MAVADVIAALEQHFGIEVHDDEISAQHFATLGSLSAFVRGAALAMNRAAARAAPPP